MRILLVEPYYGGSHAAWADGYCRFSRHDVHLVAHDARFWKWRMQGGFLTLAEEARRVVAEAGPPDLVLASDMLHLPAFLGAVRRAVGDVPAVLYLHENQMTYPMGPRDVPDLSYAVMNWTSMAVADRVFFNSEFHRTEMLDALPGLLGRFPDYRHVALAGPVTERCEVLPVGIDLARLDGDRDAPGDDPPVILWNQRWEHDKAPHDFFAAIDVLAASGAEFLLAVAGESFVTEPEEFVTARRRHADRLVHFGFAAEEAYRALLRRADVVASTALHEFFGISVIEAIYAGAFPVLPDRLVYPERIPAEHHARCLYGDPAGLVDRMRWAIDHRSEAAAVAAALRPEMARFDWSVVAPEYDRRFEKVLREG